MFAAPIIALTLLAAAIMAMRINPDYQAIATLLVEPPSDTTSALQQQEPEADPASLVSTVSPSIIANIMTSDRVVKRVGKDGGPAEYGVDVGDDNILTVTATSNESGQAVPTVEAVLSVMDQVVSARYSGALGTRVRQGSIEILSEPLDEKVARGGRYRAVGSAILQPPASATINPFANPTFGSRILEVRMAANDTRREILKDSKIAIDYTVERIPRDEAPLLFLTVTGASPDTVMSTMDRAIDVMRSITIDRQQDAGISEGAAARIDVLARPEEASLASSNLLRPLVVVVGMGAAAAVGAAVLADTWFLRRRKRDRTPGEVRSAAVNRSPQVAQPTTSESEGPRTMPRREPAGSRGPARRGYGGHSSASRDVRPSGRR